MRLTSEFRVPVRSCAGFRRAPIVLLVLAAAACLLTAGEDETPSADEKTSKIGESDTTQKVAVPAAAPSGFSKTGKKCTASCSTSTASVEAGKLTVSSAGSQLSFEYLAISWGGEPATIGKPETTVSEKIASTSRGGGVVETVTSRPEGFENDLVFAKSGGKGDLVIEGTISTALAIERTFPCDPAAGEFQTDGEVTFIDGAGSRPLQVNPISVKDAAGKSMVATVEFRTTTAGYDFKFKIPETWISEATFPVTVDPLIGSPAALNTESSGKNYTSARGAFGAGKYFAAYERTDGSSADVYARMINADGTLPGAQFSVATGSSHQRNPKVAYSPASGGVFGVVFMDGNNCILKRYDTSGALLATHTINNAAYSGLGGVGIATNSTGDFLCTFVVTSSWPQSPWGLWGEVRSPSGSVVYDDVQLVQDSGGGQSGVMSNPEPIWNSSRSEWYVLWLQNQALHGKGWNNAMTSGATSDVTFTNWAEWPRITWNSVDDQYLAVYAYGNVCYGQRIAPEDGSLMGSAFQLNTTPGVDKNQPSVAFSALANRFVTAYTKGYSPVGGIYGQVVTASGTLWKDMFTVDDGSSYLENSSCLIANPTNDEFLALWADKAWNNTFSVIYYVRLEITPPAVPTISITHSTSAPWTMTLSWAKDSAADLSGYNVYRATTAGGPYGAPVFVPPPGGATVTYEDSTVSTDVRYYYVVESVDTRANVSDLSVEVSDIIDTTIPATPTGLAGTPADMQVDLTWDANGESDLAGYNAWYRTTAGPGTWTQANGTLIPADPNPSFSVTGLVNGTSYDFAVSAKDTAGNESPKCTPISVTPADSVAPAAPVGLAGTPADMQVDLTWTANGEGDLAGYNVYCRTTSPPGSWEQKNGALLGSPAFSVTGLDNGVSYDFAVTAKDTSGNESAMSTPISVTPADAVPPVAPTGLAGTAGDTVVDLTWTPNSEGDLAGYNVYYRVTGDTEWIQKNGALVGGPSYSVTGLANWLNYDFAVSAKDTSGNESTKSTSITKAPDGPISPPSLDASNERKTNDSTPAITGTSTRGWTVTLYQGTLAIGSGLVDATGHFNISTDELSEGSHIIQAKATPPSPGAPTSGLSSGRVVTIDVTPPAIPTGLSVLFGDSFADLRWDANTEEDLLGYNIYRREPGVSDWTKVNDKPVTGERYLDESVVNAHTYEYRITAVDDTLDEN